MLRKNQQRKSGQALVEFALIITVLLMLIFLIIESARILQAWVTVQSAAREGARYAITGRSDNPCEAGDLPKFADICSEVSEARVASIINVTHQGLAGLPLNETSGIFEDDNYYQIEVWGINEFGEMTPYSGGLPETPVVVRAYYRVPIITPLLRPIAQSVPVFGQVTMNNESFGQLGSADQGRSVPPALPPIPTVGVTPSPTPSPTNTFTPTPGPSDTPTNTPTNTPEPICDVRFLAQYPPVAGDFSILINGEPGETVELIDVTTGISLGTDELADRPDPDRPCDGLADFDPPNFADPLIEGHLLLVRSTDGTADTAFVRAAPPTPTPTPSNTPPPTPIPSNTPTPSLTPTPLDAYISRLVPDCTYTEDSSTTITVFFVNWEPDEAIAVYFDGDQVDLISGGRSSRDFSSSFTVGQLNDGVYVVRAVSASDDDTIDFTVPCGVPPTPSPTTTPRPATPAPEDLIIVGPPTLVSTRPVTAFEPVQFSMVVSNTGDLDINSSFFIDMFFNLQPPPGPFSTTLPLDETVGWTALSRLGGRESRVITITAQTGFKNQTDHLVYGFVDSFAQIAENNEENNISTPAAITGVQTVAATPTPTATPDFSGTDNIGGFVYFVFTEPAVEVVPWFRADVKLWEGSEAVRQLYSERTGSYLFGSVPDNAYTVSACINIDGQYYQTMSQTVRPPNVNVNLYVIQDSSFIVSRCP